MNVHLRDSHDVNSSATARYSVWQTSPESEAVVYPFNGEVMSLGVDVGSIGDAHGTTDGAISYRYSDEATGVYRRLVVSGDGKRVIGAVLVGDNASYDTLLQYAQNGIALPADPASLILPSVEGAPTLGADATNMYTIFKNTYRCI